MPASPRLCQVQTDDGLRLDGFFETSPHVLKPKFPSAWLMLHGTGSNFYSTGVLARFAKQALADGSTVLRVNTRGHDVATQFRTRTGLIRGGAAFEVVGDCRRDVRAWVDFLRSEGHQDIGLLGHSMGAVKAIYAMAHEHFDAVKRVVAISPPRFHHESLMASPENEDFRKSMQTARDLIAQNRGGELMSVAQPLPLLLTAETFWEKYGPENRYDILKHFPRLSCPTLVVLGTESVRTSSAFRGLPEALQTLLRETPDLPISFEQVTGANTGYVGFQDEPYQIATAWWGLPGD